MFFHIKLHCICSHSEIKHSLLYSEKYMICDCGKGKPTWHLNSSLSYFLLPLQLSLCIIFLLYACCLCSLSLPPSPYGVFEVQGNLLSILSKFNSQQVYFSVLKLLGSSLPFLIHNPISNCPKLYTHSFLCCPSTVLGVDIVEDVVIFIILPFPR